MKPSVPKALHVIVIALLLPSFSLAGSGAARPILAGEVCKSRIGCTCKCAEILLTALLAHDVFHDHLPVLTLTSGEVDMSPRARGQAC